MYRTVLVPSNPQLRELESLLQEYRIGPVPVQYRLLIEFYYFLNSSAELFHLSTTNVRRFIFESRRAEIRI